MADMAHTLAELAQMVDGIALGDTTIIIQGVAPIQSALPGEITFLENPERSQRLDKCRASAVVVPKGFQIGELPLIQADNVVEAFEIIARHFIPKHPVPARSISEHAFISPTAKIAADVLIEPFVTIGDEVEIGEGCTIYSGARIHAGARIGPGTTIFSNAVLYENTMIGRRCLIHAGAIIGAYGFGYHSSANGHRLCSQLGNVRIGDDVEIGACSTIDRATYGSTLIEDGTKIDNLVMVGHNCRIGKHNLLCAHTGIAGSTTTGDFVVMAGRVGIRDHVHIGSGAVLGAMAGIMGDIPENSRVIGIPATPEKEQFKLQINIAKLPEMRKELKVLQQAVKSLTHQIERLEKTTLHGG